MARILACISGFLKEIVVWALFPSAQIDRPFFPGKHHRPQHQHKILHRRG